MDGNFLTSYQQLKIDSFINYKRNLQKQQTTLWNLFKDKTQEKEQHLDGFLFPFKATPTSREGHWVWPMALLKGNYQTAPWTTDLSGSPKASISGKNGLLWFSCTRLLREPQRQARCRERKLHSFQYPTLRMHLLHSPGECHLRISGEFTELKILLENDEKSSRWQC